MGVIRGYLHLSRRGIKRVKSARQKVALLIAAVDFHGGASILAMG